MMRAGRYVQQATGYKAFIPAPLPPDPPVHLDGALLALLLQADQAVGRLDPLFRGAPASNQFLPQATVFVLVCIP